MAPTTTEPSQRSLVERLRRAVGGIRTRVVVASIVLLLAALLTAVVATRQLLLVGVTEQSDRDMAQEVEELRALAASVDPATGSRFSVMVGTSHGGPLASAVGYTGLAVGATRFGARTAAVEQGSL